MASSENLPSIEPWLFRQTFSDSWFSESCTRDTDTLTKALQKTLCNTTDSISQFLMTDLSASPTPTASNMSGSEPEVAPKRKRNAISVKEPKATKRRSRASKRSNTTFIAADPANFRRMVQQVTGVKYDSSMVLKPEAQRPRNGGGGCLPTHDTSSFLLEGSQLGVWPGRGPMTYGLTGGSSDGGLDFESFPSFPTLESWKVM